MTIDILVLCYLCTSINIPYPHYHHVTPTLVKLTVRYVLLIVKDININTGV